MISCSVAHCGKAGGIVYTGQFRAAAEHAVIQPRYAVGEMYALQTGASLECGGIDSLQAFRQTHTGQTGAAGEGVLSNRNNGI